MKKFSIISMLLLFTMSTYAVDIQEYFASSSTGTYHPFQNNGTISLKFDFQVTQGPVNSSFLIAFVLSDDVNIFDHSDVLIDTFRVLSAKDGSSEFPTDFGPQAPYLIGEMLKKANVVHGKMYFLGCILDYNSEIAESNEGNNSGAIQMPPITITGNIGFNTNLNLWESSIKPNPMQNTALIEIEGPTIKQSSIQVYSMDGKLIRDLNVLSFPYKFQRKEMPSGVYQMLILSEGKAIIQRKIIIQ